MNNTIQDKIQDKIEELCEEFKNDVFVIQVVSFLPESNSKFSVFTHEKDNKNTYINATKKYFEDGNPSIVNLVNENGFFHKISSPRNATQESESKLEAKINLIPSKETSEFDVLTENASNERWDQWCTHIDGIYKNQDKTILSVQESINTYNNSNNLYCAIFFVISKKIEEKDISNYISSSTKLLFNIIKLLFSEYHKNLIQQTIKLTIANIVSRGLAHTDGSHTMKFFEQKFLNSEENDLEDIKTDFKNYNTHLRNVMELIADISGGLGSQSSYTYNLKEVLTSQINKNYFTKDTTETFLSKSLVDNKKNCQFDFEEDNLNFNVSIPGGENGITAFLQMLKNIYRNIFKHNLGGVQDDSIKLQFSINNDISDELKGDYYKISLTEENTFTRVEDIDNIIDKINKVYTAQTIIGDGNKTIETGWGLMEIKIMSAYLLGLPIHEITSIDGNEDSMYLNGKVYPKKWIYIEKNNENNLVHNFYLRKDKRFILLYDNSISNKSMIDKYKKKGVDFITYSEWDKLENYNFQNTFITPINPSKSHQIVYCDIIKKPKIRNIKVVSDAKLGFKGDIESVLKQIDKSPEVVNEKWVEEITDDALETSFTFGMERFYNNEKNVFDDHHGVSIKIKNTSGIEKYTWHNLDYLELFELKHLENKVLDDTNKIESIKTNIAILDERLQEEFINPENKNGNLNELIQNGKCIADLSFRDLLEKRGVFVPQLKTQKDIEIKGEEIVNLYELMYEKKKGDNKYTKFTNLLKYYFNEKKCAYVVVHFSGLEVIVDSISNSDYKEMKKEMSRDEKIKADKNLLDNSKKLEVVYQDLIVRKLKLKRGNKGQYLILTSGKGTPITIPNHSYFISLNNLEYILKNKPKFEIIQALNSIRQITKD